jgi:lipopolysaccharide exporter
MPQMIGRHIISMEDASEGDVAEGRRPMGWHAGSGFASDVLKLVGGTALAQALGILASPIITRMYGPDAFGTAALFTSIVAIASVVACLRYEVTIVLPQTNKEAANLLALSLTSAATMGIVVSLSVWVFRDTILSLLKASALEPYLWIVPISVFMSGTFLALTYWNSRTKRFGRLSKAKVTASVAAIGTQLIAGISGYATGGSLIGAGLFGSAVSTLILGGQIWRDDWQILKESIGLSYMIEGAKRYRKFLLFDTWSSLLNSISWQLPALLLSAFFSTTIVGYYTLGMMAIILPMNLIGGSISQVFFQRASKAYSEGNIATVAEGLFRVLILVSLFPMLILSLLGKDMFVIFFGARWSEAGIYIQMLSIWGIFWFISSPLSSLFAVLGKLRFSLELNLVLFSTRLISLCIGGWLSNARLAIALFAISGTFVYSYLCYKTMIYSGVPRIKIINSLSYNFILFIPAGVSLIALEYIGVSGLIRIFVSFVFLMIYYLYMIKCDPQTKSIIANFR